MENFKPGIENPIDGESATIRKENITSRSGIRECFEVGDVAQEKPLSVGEKIAEMKRIKEKLEKEELQRKTAFAESRKKIILTPEKRTEKLDGIMAQIAEKQRETFGWPIGDDGRIRMEAFDGKDNYKGIVSGDIACIEGIEKKKEKLKNVNSGGEKMEKLTSILFFKHLNDANLVRADKFDDKDLDHQLDFLLYNKNGSLMVAFACAFRDDIAGYNLEDNRREVEEKNRKGGGKAKYSFKGLKGDIVYGPETDVPVFWLDLDAGAMDLAIDNFSLEGPVNDSEQKAMYHFADSLYRQIDDMEFDLKQKHIKFDPEFGNETRFKERVSSLKSLLENNFPRETIKQYMAKKFLESKGTSAKTPHKRKVSRR